MSKLTHRSKSELLGFHPLQNIYLLLLVVIVHFFPETFLLTLNLFDFLLNQTQNQNEQHLVFLHRTKRATQEGTSEMEERIPHDGGPAEE